MSFQVYFMQDAKRRNSTKQGNYSSGIIENVVFKDDTSKEANALQL